MTTINGKEHEFTVSKEVLTFRFTYKGINLPNFPSDGIQLSIPYLKTNRLITSMDNVEGEQLEASKKWVISFVSKQFVGTPREKIATVVEDMIPFCVMTYPTCPSFGEHHFQTWLTYMTLAIMADDIFDDTSFLKVEEDKPAPAIKVWREVQNVIIKMLDSDLELGDYEMEGLSELAKYPKYAQYVTCLGDMFNLFAFMSPLENDQKIKADLREATSEWIQATSWGKTDQLLEYNETTYRALRKADYAGNSMIRVLAVLEGIHLPKSVTRNPQFKHLIDLSILCGAAVNDIFGLRKDIAEMEAQGDCIGMVIYKLRNGMDWMDAINQEVKLMGEHIDDYLKVRKSLLNIMKDSEYEQDFKKYLQIVDCFLGGHPFAYANSARYNSVK